MSSFTVLLLLTSLFGLIVAQQHAQVPPFLQGQSPDVINSFHRVLEKGNDLTDEQLDKEVEAWVSQQSAQIKVRYAQFKNELKMHHNNAEQTHQQAVAKLSAAAKQADAKLSAIASDPSLTASQKNQQIDAFIKELPAHVRQEIESAMQG